MKEFLEKVLFQVIGTTTQVNQFQPLAGGCINTCYRIDTPEQSYFIKYHQLQYLDMFQQEFNGLTALKEHQVLTIPEPYGYGVCEQKSYLLMEYIESNSRASDYWEQLGTGLARLHQVEHQLFGWSDDNYIGRLPQINNWQEDWVEFFWKCRLQPQITLAVDHNLMPSATLREFSTLGKRLGDLLSIEKPSLLHGDLWGGNVMVGPQGQPCVMDPAVYYGHREIELAFTTLFGGFDARFYQSYQEYYPMAAGYEARFEIYNLYPLLVHLNLFGKGYLGSIQQTLRSYL